MDLPIANAHRAAIRSIERIVAETAPPQDPVTARDGIAAMLARGSVLALTGAGISTDSGIPDYRGPRGSLRSHRPMTYQEFKHDPAARQRYWARSFVGWRRMAIAEPNEGHQLVAALQGTGAIHGVVTQNVDGLHRRAGSPDVVTLHGDLDEVKCLNCGFVESRPGLDHRLAAANPGYLERVVVDPDAVNPDGDVTLSDAQIADFTMVGCLSCGSVELKPDVVYFGENVPAERKEAVRRLEAASTGLLVIGSSLAVMSGYKLVLNAVANGRQVAIINGGPSRGDAKAHWRWRTRVTPALRELAGVVPAP
ncbi:Sir2 family NAD-dependent protein deacetylase [Arthrobacter sp. JSM 101049]|uniref:Sir2 family NAD-dependent protein deacetylase n=1 Tax=Arthrobacter sp. JSM 101049 TaxID=929097 RepID=UPI0035646015